MTAATGLVTDSASQIPPDLADRFAVWVVPVTVTVDGVEYTEGVDLDADAMWSFFADGAVPDVSTSQPSPGQMEATYRRLVEAGATEIVSVHVGESFSGTINSARLAAAAIDVPVHIVDSNTASFGVACCVWEAGAALEAGASAGEAADRAAALVPRLGTAFILQALEFAIEGGRWSIELPDGTDGVAVLAGIGADLDVVGTGRTVDELCDQMTQHLLAEPGALRVGVGLADPSTQCFVDGIEQRLAASGRDVDVVRYRVGPSIAAHTGPGTAGGFSYQV